MNKNKFFKIKERKKSGINSIEMVLITILSLICICALLDLTTVMKKHNAISTTANYVTRVVGKQGGVQTSKPKMYPGEYVTSSQLYNDVKNNLNNAGIKDGSWTLTIDVPGEDPKQLTPDRNYAIVTHGGSIKIELTASYNWYMLSQVTPFRKTGSNTAKRETKSKFKLRQIHKTDSSIS